MKTSVLHKITITSLALLGTQWIVKVAKCSQKKDAYFSTW